MTPLKTAKIINTKFNCCDKLHFYIYKKYVFYVIWSCLLSVISVCKLLIIFQQFHVFSSVYFQRWRRLWYFVVMCSVDQRWWGSPRVLQWSQLIPGVTGTDEVGERPVGPSQSSDVPHQPCPVAGSVHRGQERLHGDQVSLSSTARRHRQSSDTFRLCSRGNLQFLSILITMWTVVNTV